MSVDVNSNTKMAVRASVAAILCILVTHEFTLERAYWTYLTAFMLITQSFGEGIYRSLIRFIMTVVGCLIGWLLYLPLQHNPHALMGMSLLSLFLMLYWLKTSLIGRTLATGVLLVAAFGMMNGGWTFSMLMARIQDTLIGAVIAIIVNGLILPEFSKMSVKKIFDALRSKVLAVHKEFAGNPNQSTLLKIQAELQSLEKDHQKLTQSLQLARYEFFLPRHPKKEIHKAMLLQTDIVFAYLNALLDIKLTEFGPANPIKKELAASGEEYYNTRLAAELKKLCLID